MPLIRHVTLDKSLGPCLCLIGSQSEGIVKLQCLLGVIGRMPCGVTIYKVLAMLVINIFMHQRDAVPFFLVLRHKIFGIFLDSLSTVTSSSSSPAGSTFWYIQNPTLPHPLTATTQVPAALIFYLGCCSHLLIGLHPCPWSVLNTAARMILLIESQMMSLCQNLPVALQSKHQSPSVAYRPWADLLFLFFSRPHSLPPLSLRTGHSLPQTPHGHLHPMFADSDHCI